MYDVITEEQAVSNYNEDGRAPEPHNPRHALLVLRQKGEGKCAVCQAFTPYVEASTGRCLCPICAAIPPQVAPRIRKPGKIARFGG